MIYYVHCDLIKALQRHTDKKEHILSLLFSNILIYFFLVFWFDQVCGRFYDAYKNVTEVNKGASNAASTLKNKRNSLKYQKRYKVIHVIYHMK